MLLCIVHLINSQYWRMHRIINEWKNYIYNKSGTTIQLTYRKEFKVNALTYIGNFQRCTPITPFIKMHHFKLETYLNRYRGFLIIPVITIISRLIKTMKRRHTGEQQWQVELIPIFQYEFLVRATSLINEYDRLRKGSQFLRDDKPKATTWCHSCSSLHT